MTPDEIINKWIGGSLPGDDAATRRATSGIVAGLKADIQQAIADEREACAKLAEEACLDIGATALEAEGVGRRTRDAIAARIRARCNTSATESMNRE